MYCIKFTILRQVLSVFPLEVKPILHVLYACSSYRLGEVARLKVAPTYEKTERCPEVHCPYLALGRRGFLTSLSRYSRIVAFLTGTSPKCILNSIINEFLFLLQFNLTLVNKYSIIYYNFSKRKIPRQLRKTGNVRKAIYCP